MDVTRTDHASSEEMELILRIGLDISAELDLQRLLLLTAESIKRSLGYSYCSLLLKEGNDLVIRAVTEYPEAIIGKRIPLGQGLTGRCALGKKETIVPDLARCEHYIHLGDGIFRSELDIPIIFREKVLGVLNTQSTRENAFGDRDVHVLKILANQLGVALHNAQVRTQLELVQEIGIQLLTIRSTNELFATIVGQVRERLHYDSCALLEVEEGHLRLKAATGEFPADLPGLEIPIGEGITGECAREKRCVNVGDVRRHPGYIASGIEDVRSEIAAPILFEGVLLGVLTVESRTENAFDHDDERLLSIVSAQVAVGIHNARMYAAVEEMAVTDALTGLHNYRYFYERLTIEMSRASRYARPLSLIMIDLDDFKGINDTFGHLKGDEALREVARTIRRNIRRYDETVIMKETEIDVASRYGGEEFVVIMPETGPDGAAIAAERLRSALATQVSERLALSLGGGETRKITGSIGVTAFRKGEDPESFIKRTDDAVYEAKRSGKNRVVLMK
jgi:diguanylate cyclase (GGDEF)-like protein